jgi:predicted RNase H-like nuclease (RuvC/YqgF family)
MTKQDLQKELLEKVKPGTKPSDIKKQSKKQAKKPVLSSPIVESDEGYSSEEEKIPTPPIAPNQKIKNLQNQIKSLQRQLQTYKDFKSADLKIKEKYKEEIKELKSTLNNTEQKNNEYKENIKELQTKLEKQYKTIQDLQNQVKNKVNDKGEIKELFNCYNCKKQQSLSLLVLELPEGKLCQPC